MAMDPEILGMTEERDIHKLVSQKVGVTGIGSRWIQPRQSPACLQHSRPLHQPTGIAFISGRTQPLFQGVIRLSGLPGWSESWESPLLCKGHRFDHRFDPRSGRTPRAAGKLWQDYWACIPEPFSAIREAPAMRSPNTITRTIQLFTGNYSAPARDKYRKPTQKDPVQPKIK